MSLNESGKLSRFNVLLHYRSRDGNQRARIVANDVDTQNLVIVPTHNYLDETIRLTGDQCCWIGAKGKTAYLYYPFPLASFSVRPAEAISGYVKIQRGMIRFSFSCPIPIAFSAATIPSSIATWAKRVPPIASPTA